jgi:thiol-disulfide isomerase/thioredoxin
MPYQKLGLSLFVLMLILFPAIGCSPSTDDADPVVNPPADVTSSEDPVEEPEPVVEPDPEVNPEPIEDPEPVDDGTLGVGDAAPAISIAEWITGEPVDSLETGQVYVVEFWATWCPPCRSSMPHLSSLQEEYGDDVIFIGVTREDKATVDGFLEQDQSEDTTWAEAIKYRLAIDSGDATNNAYMKAAGQTGIPTAFIVGKEGNVDWIGHPMRMDDPLAGIVAGE